MSLEKEYALELKNKLDKKFLKGTIYFCLYYDEEPKLAKSNFELLQKECNNLGFNILNLCDTPFDEKENKRQWKQQKGIAVFSEESLHNPNMGKFDLRHRDDLDD